LILYDVMPTTVLKRQHRGSRQNRNIMANNGMWRSENISSIAPGAKRKSKNHGTYVVGKSKHRNDVKRIGSGISRQRAWRGKRDHRQ